MGVCAQFKDLSPWAAGFLRREPWLVETFVCWRRSDNVIAPWTRFLAAAAQRAAIDIGRTLMDMPSTGDFVLEGLERSRPTDVDRVRLDLAPLRSEWERPYLDLDKIWRGLVTEGVDDAASRAILGGEPLGADIGYGPARLIDVAEIPTRAEDLAALLARWPSDRSVLQGDVEALVNYYTEAAREGRAMLAWLT